MRRHSSTYVDRVEKGMTAMVMSQLLQKHLDRSEYLQGAGDAGRGEGTG